jgi:NADPH2:quinone reductase
MLAIVRTARGTAELRHVATPEPAAGERLVRVCFSGLNPFDLQVRDGDIGPTDEPLILGAEAVGVCDGDWVTVGGSGVGAVRNGTLAEWVAVPDAAVRMLPGDLDPVLGATVGIAGKTAWRAVHQLAKVEASDVVLVLGASGGVGSYACQLAAATGARVVAHTGSGTKAAALQDKGLETVVAEDGATLSAALMEAGTANQVSVVLDPLAGDYFSALQGVIAPRSRIVTYGALAGRMTALDLGTFYRQGHHMMGTSGGTTTGAESDRAYEGAMAAAASGALKVAVERVSIAAAVSAMGRLQSRSVLGKLVVDLT